MFCHEFSSRATDKSSTARSPTSELKTVQQNRGNLHWTYKPRLSLEIEVSLALPQSKSELDQNSNYFYVVTLVSTVFYLLIYLNLPTLLFPGTPHDDGLYIAHAYSIVSGHWLGRYSQFTLMKASGYLLFLASISLFRIPVQLAHSILWSFSVWLLSYVTQKIFQSVIFSLGVFEVLLWNFGPHSMRVVRDEIYTPQILLTFSLLLLALFVTSRYKVVLYASLSGLVFGWCWITREDGMVAVPPFLILLDMRFSQGVPDRTFLQRAAQGAAYSCRFVCNCISHDCSGESGCLWHVRNC